MDRRNSNNNTAAAALLKSKLTAPTQGIEDVNFTHGNIKAVA